MYKDYKWTDKKVDSTTFLFPQLNKVLSHEKNCYILDLGCGNGEIANKLISEGYCVYGVDGSISGVEVANKYNSGHFYVMNFEADGFPEELSEFHFDTIISTEVLEHLYSPDSYMKLCSRILNPGGSYFDDTLSRLFKEFDSQYHGKVGYTFNAALGRRTY